MEREINRYRRFAERVSGLTPEAWSRIQERCGGLTGESFAALLRRANLMASVYQLPSMLTPVKQQSPTSRVLLGVINGVHQVVQTGIAVAFELGSEFDSTEPAPEEPPRTSSHPEINTYVDAALHLEATLRRNAPDPGVAAAIRAGAQAVLRRDSLMSAAAFDDVYRYVEDEIPFDSLEPPQPLLTAAQVAE
jgi:hypothetical protein